MQNFIPPRQCVAVAKFFYPPALSLQAIADSSKITVYAVMPRPFQNSATYFALGDSARLRFFSRFAYLRPQPFREGFSISARMRRRLSAIRLTARPQQGFSPSPRLHPDASSAVHSLRARTLRTALQADEHCFVGKLVKPSVSSSRKPLMSTGWARSLSRWHEIDPRRHYRLGSFVSHPSTSQVGRGGSLRREAGLP